MKPSIAVDILPGVQSGFDRWQRETIAALEQARFIGDVGNLNTFSYGKRFTRPKWIGSHTGFCASPLPGRVQRFLCEHMRLPVESVCRVGHADVVLSMVLQPLRTRAPIVLGVADVSWRVFANQYRTAFTELQIALAESAIAKADHILTISQASADDLIRGGFPKERLTVAPLGVSEEFTEIPEDAGEKIRNKYELPSTFVLYVGGVNERKNLNVLTSALDQMERRPLLVIAGVPPDEGLTFWHLDRPYIRHLKYVPGEDLPGLYQAATMLVFPSKLEGFGLPLIEAASVGLPILASDIPVFREIGGTAVALFDPGSPTQLSRLMYDLLTNPDERRKLGDAAKRQAQLYTRERYQAGVLESVRKTIKQAHASTQPTKADLHA